MSVLFTRRGAPPRLGKKASDYAVGDSVFLPVNGVNTEFLVVHQGKPSSIYSTTFENGTILLMKDCFGTQKWHSSNVNDYENSTIHSYLNSTFFNLLGSAVQNAVKQVKIPYRKGSGASTTITSGENGLSCKIFLLSGTETGFTSSTTVLPTNEGAKLDYFVSGTSSAANSKRVANLNGTATIWMLRSPYCNSEDPSSSLVCLCNVSGDHSYQYCNGTARGVRPALVINGSTKFDPDTNIIL